MQKQTISGMSRRRFLGTAAISIGGVAILSSLSACKQNVTDDKLKLGFIGMGRQSMFLLGGFIQIPGIRVVAGCDVYRVKCKRFEKRINAFYKKAKIEVEVQTYEKFEDLLARPDIDAVVIAVPDHSHARIAIAACKAGKDVYLEKPLSFTIKEGQELRRVVRETHRILAVGSMQRSMPIFQHAVKLVQSGALGQIEKVHAYVGAPPRPFDLPEEPIPADLNWDLWQGSLPNPVLFNKELDPPITVDPDKDEEYWGAWRWFKGMGGGFTTDWGAHMFDIAQWGLGMDKNGPVEISPIGDGTQYIQFKYANGIVLTSEPFDEKNTKGVKFIGENGWIAVSRSDFNASDDKFLPPPTQKEDAANVPLAAKIPHQVDFIEATRQRREPVVPVEIGHSSCTLCNLANIAFDLQRPLKWDPKNEVFIGDTDGTLAARMHYKYRSGFSLM